MKRSVMKISISLMLCAILVCSFSTPVAAGPADHGVSVTFNESYREDGKLKMSYTINTGEYASNASDTKTEVWAEIYNSAGKKVVSWKSASFEPNKKITRKFSYDWNNLPTGKYTFKLYLRLYGTIRDGSLYYMNNMGWCWSRQVDHTAPSSVWLDSSAFVTRDDGSYATRIKLGYSGAKGKIPNIEIYDEKGNLMYSAAGKNISYDKGTYAFLWNGFPKDGGVQCESGNYKIKYWLDGSNPKQSQVWLDIY
ncbi:MAG: hypothetical protein GX115_09555 [Ruminiclostridium sp.]|nr:hypothetical protein [Ruminiclostridium sp.]